MKHSIKKLFYTVDHKWLFLFGYVFYLLVPYLAGSLDIFKGYPGMDLYQGFFRQIPGSKKQLYLIVCVVWLFAFYAGHFTFKFVAPKKKSLNEFEKNNVDYGIKYVGLLLLGVMVLFIYLARNSIFAGYASYDIAARGKLSTLLVVFNFFMLYQLVSTNKLSISLITGTAICCIVLLSMGGRMYVFQTLVIVLIYKTSFAKKRWNFFQIAAVVLFGFIVGSIAGIWRLGTSYTIERAGYSFMAEPLFTWISTATLLMGNQIPAVNIPLNFITSFFNLVPNTIVSLNSYVVSSHQMGYTYLSPLGADSIWTTYIINFGYAGSCIFVFIIGFLLNFLKYLSARHRFWAVYYILICGMLPFQFFRDGFYILNKQLFFNFLLLPSLVLLILRLIKFFNTRPSIIALSKNIA